MEVKPGRGKGDDIHFGPWYCYLDGRNEEYPARILDQQYAEALRRMDAIRNDHGDPETWDVHHWQNHNPVHTEALLQLTCGGPQIIYHGGLLHLRLRYFDGNRNRPGLPDEVAALVTHLDAESTTVELVNIGTVETRQLVLQSGAFGEHRFTTVEPIDGADSSGKVTDVDSPCFSVVLPPGRSVALKIGMERFSRRPSYVQPV